MSSHPVSRSLRLLAPFALAACGALTLASIVQADVVVRTAKAVPAPSASAVHNQPQAGGAVPAGAPVISGPNSATPGARGTVNVMIDHAKIIRLPERTQTVVVGNPVIADVTVQKNGILVVTGKSYGVTNLIALDNGGTMLAESMIQVKAPNDALVTVQRGLERESYSCTPSCQPSILLGDSNRSFGEVSGQSTQRNSLSTQR
jgi:hypothetical protein